MIRHSRNSPDTLSDHSLGKTRLALDGAGNATDVAQNFERARLDTISPASSRGRWSVVLCASESQEKVETGKEPKWGGEGNPQKKNERLQCARHSCRMSCSTMLPSIRLGLHRQ